MNYIQLVRTFKFAVNSKAAKLLKGEPSEKELALAVKTTKAYKEDAKLMAATDNVIAGKEAAPKAKEEVKPATRHSEPRRF